MTRRSRERRAAAGEGGQAAAAPPHYDAYEERRLAEEVLYLHSLWRSGPPAPAPASASAPKQPARGSRPTRARPNQRKRRRIERPAAEPEEPGSEWPLAPSPPASPSPASWPGAAPSSPAPRPQPQQQQPSPASLAQRDALRAAEEFFSGRGSSGEDGDESEGSEPEDGGDAVEGFFLGLFERDAALRGYYERSHEEGEFRCMGCVGRKGKSQARRFRNCISLVHHAHDARRCGRPLAHRALAAVVCRVLGWDVTRLPSIVIDPRGTLGQALLAREGASAAAATAQEAKDNVDAGDNGHKDAVKEDVCLEKNGSLTDDKKEDVDSTMNEAPLSDGDAAKEDVDSIMNDGPLSDGDAAKEDVDKGKIGAPSNNKDGEVHDQGNGIGTAEMLGQALLVREGEGTAAATAQEAKGKVNIVDNDGTEAVNEDTNYIHPLSSKDTNDMDPLNSKDTPEELCKVVQEEGAIGKRQEHAKSADDIGDTCNVRLENNSSKEEAATENKEEHTDGVVDSGDDIDNLGNNLTDSSMS